MTYSARLGLPTFSADGDPFVTRTQWDNMVASLDASTVIGDTVSSTLPAAGVAQRIIWRQSDLAAFWDDGAALHPLFNGAIAGDLSVSGQILVNGGRVTGDGTSKGDTLVGTSGHEVTVTPAGNVTVPGTLAAGIATLTSVTLPNGASLSSNGSGTVSLGTSGKYVTVDPSGNVVAPGNVVATRLQTSSFVDLSNGSRISSDGPGNTYVGNSASGNSMAISPAGKVAAPGNGAFYEGDGVSRLYSPLNSPPVITWAPTGGVNNNVNITVGTVTVPTTGELVVDFDFSGITTSAIWAANVIPQLMQGSTAVSADETSETTYNFRYGANGTITAHGWARFPVTAGKQYAFVIAYQLTNGGASQQLNPIHSRARLITTQMAS